MTESRENWGSKIGLILAMAGNAVGLGNFWRFPYVAASNGGGAFMIPYFFALIVIGIPVMLIEWSIGRYGGKHGHGTLGPMMYLQAKQAMSPKKAIIIGSLCGMIALDKYLYEKIDKTKQNGHIKTIFLFCLTLIRQNRNIVL